MKKILIAGFLFVASSSFAQKVKVSESTERIGPGSNNALSVVIYEASPEMIEKEWKSLMKKYDAKVSSSDGVFADNATVKTMGLNTMDIYARTEKVKDGETKLIVGFDLGGAYLSSSQHSAQFKEAKQIVETFAASVMKDAIADQLKVAEKLLDKTSKAHITLLEENENLAKDIEDYKNKIKKAENQIATNRTEAEKKKQEIEVQKKEVDKIKNKQAAL